MAQLFVKGLNPSQIFPNISIARPDKENSSKLDVDNFGQDPSILIIGCSTRYLNLYSEWSMILKYWPHRERRMIV